MSEKMVLASALDITIGGRLIKNNDGGGGGTLAILDITNLILDSTLAKSLCLSRSFYLF